MAAPAVARSPGPALCPSFAVVCSFLERYGAVLDLPEMSFPQMERYLRDTSAGKSPAAVPVGRRRRRRSGGEGAATLETEGEGGHRRHHHLHQLHHRRGAGGAGGMGSACGPV